jgi:hypothetical protein
LGLGDYFVRISAEFADLTSKTKGMR